jgi:hypothetical protein
MPPTTVRASASLCGDGLRDHQGVDQCYPPAKVALAEHQLPWVPARPTIAVQRAVHLRLRQVEVREYGHPFGISYLYGRIPTNARQIPLLASKRFPYVLVSEISPRTSSNRILIFRSTQVSNAGGAQTTSYGPWEFAANLPSNLSLHVTTNLSRAVVATIGYSLLRESRSGK